MTNFSFSLSRPLLLCLFVVGFAPSASFARTASSDCPQYKEPRVKTTLLFSDPSYNETLDLQGISLMSKRSKYKDAAEKEVPMGYTDAAQKMQTSFQLTSSPLPDGTICAQISSLELSFGYSDIIVYTAKELRSLESRGGKDSCAYQEMLKHELKHVATDKEIAETFLPTLEKIMPKFVGQMGMLHASSVNEANKHFHEAIEQYVDVLNINLATIHNDRQKKIDTPEEYQRLSTACNGVMAKMLRQKPP